MRQSNIFLHLQLSQNLSSLNFERQCNFKTLKISPGSYSIISPGSYSVSEQTSWYRNHAFLLFKGIKCAAEILIIKESYFSFLVIVKFSCIFVIVFCALSQFTFSVISIFLLNYFCLHSNFLYPVFFVFILCLFKSMFFST